MLVPFLHTHSPPDTPGQVSSIFAKPQSEGCSDSGPNFSKSLKCWVVDQSLFIWPDSCKPASLCRQNCSLTWTKNFILGRLHPYLGQLLGQTPLAKSSRPTVSFCPKLCNAPSTFNSHQSQQKDGTLTPIGKATGVGQGASTARGRGASAAQGDGAEEGDPGSSPAKGCGPADPPRTLCKSSWGRSHVAGTRTCRAPAPTAITVP